MNKKEIKVIDELTKINIELKQKNKEQQRILDKIKEYIKDNACYDKDIKQCCRDLLTNECDYILELLEEIDG